MINIHVRPIVHVYLRKARTQFIFDNAAKCVIHNYHVLIEECTVASRVQNEDSKTSWNRSNKALYCPGFKLHVYSG